MSDFRKKVSESLSKYSKEPATYVLLFAGLLLLAIGMQAYGIHLIPLFWLLVALGIALFLIGLIIFFCFVQDGLVNRIIGYVTAAILIFGCWSGFSVLENLQSSLQDMSAPLEQSDIEVSLFSSKNVPVENIQSLSNNKVGFLSGRNDDINKQILEKLKEQNVNVDPVYYDTLEAIQSGLNGQKVSALCLNDYDLELIDLQNENASFSSSLEAVESFAFPVENMDGNPSVDVVHTPFTMLAKVYSSRDVEKIDEILLIVVNPIVNEIDVVAIPRAYWVDYQCADYACSITTDKLAYAGYMSDQQLCDIISYLYAVDVDFVMDLSISDLIDGFGFSSLTIVNPDAISYGNTSFDKGEITLTAEQAKIYARVSSETTAQGRNLQHNAYRIIKALINRSPVSSLYSLPQRLESFSKSIRSDLSYDQLCALIQLFFYEGRDWQIYDILPDGKDTFLYSDMLTSFVFVITPDQASINETSKAIHALLAKTERSETDGQGMISLEEADRIQSEKQEQEVQEQPENENQEDSESEDGENPDENQDESDETSSDTDQENNEEQNSDEEQQAQDAADPYGYYDIYGNYYPYGYNPYYPYGYGYGYQ